MLLARGALLGELGVSRETARQIDRYIHVLYDWQKKINLISAPSDLQYDAFCDMVWQRHMLDSLQLKKHLCLNKSIVDLGSGAGFPGMVLALAHDTEVYLIESDRRKCQFLSEVSRIIGANVIIINKRIESVFPGDLPESFTLTSRACASVSKILQLTTHLHGACDFLLLKGEKHAMELIEAEKHWQMNTTCFPSITSPHSRIIHIHGVQPNGQETTR